MFNFTKSGNFLILASSGIDKLIRSFDLTSMSGLISTFLVTPRRRAPGSPSGPSAKSIILSGPKSPSRSNKSTLTATKAS